MQESPGTRSIEDEVLWFQSKVDWWLGVLLIALPVTSVAVCAGAAIAGDLGVAAFSFLVGVLPVGALMVGLVWPVRYGIGATTLVVRFGLCRQTIRLDQISEVRPSRSPLSSPALSLDRLRVRYGKGRLSFTLISPARKEEFLGELAARTNLVYRDAGLVLPD